MILANDTCTLSLFTVEIYSEVVFLDGHVKGIQIVVKETQDKAKNSVTFKTRDNYSNDMQQRNPLLIQQMAMWFPGSYILITAESLKVDTQGEI